MSDPNLTSLPPILPQILIEDQVRMALREDLGRAGDITTASTIGPEKRADVVLNSRDDGVICGLELAEMSFKLLDALVVFEPLVRDGDRVSAGQNLVKISGAARSILSAERVALNFMMHLSGISTYTSQFADLIAHTNAKICCTRKTIPGLRALEKYAVKCGGGSNHRYGLDDAILIKDNHIAVAGSVEHAIKAARAYAGHLVQVEVEVDNLEQMTEALQAKPDVIMLDNMTLDELRQGVALNNGQVRLEASGNVSIDTVKAIAETGVDYISTSKITMAAPTLDVGLDISIS